MIDREYFRDIDSNALAAAARLSRFRFIHAFTERYNISPHQYLLRTRLAAAKRLLATSRETIDVIAAATGFRSGACLNRAVTRVEGHPFRAPAGHQHQGLTFHGPYDLARNDQSAAQRG